MPQSYRYFTCPKIPHLAWGEQIQSTGQLGTPWEDDAPVSILEGRGDSDASGFRKYRCVHQWEKRVNAIYRRERVKHLIFEREFYAFYVSGGGYLLSQGGDVAADFFDRLSKDHTRFEARPCRLDMSQARDLELGPTTGGWFGHLKIADVRSAGIFGSEHIADSEEWARYESVGEISAMTMKVVDQDGVTRPIMLTQDRLVLLYNDYGEAEDLPFVAHLNTILEQIAPAA